MTVRAVTFDCWGTLIADSDMSRAVARRVSAIVEASDSKLTVTEAQQLHDLAWRTHHDAWVAGTQVGSPGMAEVCARELGAADDGLAQRLCLAFEEASLEGSVHALDGARDTLVALREAGVRTALVCDTGFTPGRLVRRFLDDHGLAEHLEFLAFSNEVGVPKPHPRIFLTALTAVGASPGESVHVGDLRRTDIAGAKGVGMRAVRITAVNATGTPSGLPSLPTDPIPEQPAEGPAEDAVVGSHAELLSVLGAMGAPV